MHSEHEDKEEDFPEESGSESSGSDEDGVGSSSKLHKRLQHIAEASNRADFNISSFDNYFQLTSRSARTSSAVFSQLVEPLTPEEYSSHLRKIQSSSEFKSLKASIDKLEESHVEYFPMFLSELAAGFNLLFYGYGSKRKVLNRLAQRCTKHGPVVVVNAFFPAFTFKNLLSSIEKTLDISSLPLHGSGPDAQCRRILDHISSSSKTKRLFMVIHNIDSSSLRQEKVKNLLATLAAHPRIHLIASIDHINAPLLWSSSDLFSRRRPEDEDEDETSSSSDPVAGFAWLWHDLTTMHPYDFELSYVDRTSYAGVSGNRNLDNATTITPSGGAMSEKAAEHVLASVTERARRLFILLGQKQIDAMMSLAGSTTSQVTLREQVSMTYDALFTAARDEFIATNDTALRALLGEFRDHGLVISISTASEAGESLFIPLSKEALGRVIQGLKGT